MKKKRRKKGKGSVGGGDYIGFEDTLGAAGSRARQQGGKFQLGSFLFGIRYRRGCSTVPHLPVLSI